MVMQQAIPKLIDLHNFRLLVFSSVEQQRSSSLLVAHRSLRGGRQQPPTKLRRAAAVIHVGGHVHAMRHAVRLVKCAWWMMIHRLILRV